MRPWHYYTIAALLVLASTPIYRFIWTHRHSDGGSPAPAAAVSVPRPNRPSSVALPTVAMTRDESAALAALTHGRAKCIEGVVYRTYDHVIEPWGQVKCFAPAGVQDGPMVGVSATAAL